MIRLRCAAPIAAVLILAGCGTVLPDPAAPTRTITLTGHPLTDFAPVATKLAAYTAADVDAALLDAQAQNPPDAIGQACWSTVKQALPLLSTPPGAGAALGLQKGRDLQRRAPLILDACNGVIPFLALP